MKVPFHSLFRNLSKLLLASGTTFQEFSQAMKLALVRETIAQGFKTDSAISLRTGLQRRDITTLKKMAAPPEAEFSSLAQLVSKWIGDPEFEGRPLPRLGDHPSFETLSRSLRKDVHPRTLLDALVANDTVQISADGGTVTLLRKSYTPALGSEEQLGFLDSNVGDHLATAVENLSAADPNFERAVFFEGLNPEDVNAIAALHRRLQMEVLEKINAEALKRVEKQTSPSPDAIYRFRAGGYFHAAKDPKE